MNNEKQKLWLIISFAAFAVLFVAFLVSQSWQRRVMRKERERRETTVKVVPSPTVKPSPSPSPFPTKTEEEKAVIREIETWEVKIMGGKFEPATLTIKPHDQVDWVNNDTVSHKIKGKEWGGVEIRPGRRFTESFEKVGVYPYSCEFHPEEKGEVVVE